MRGARRTLIPPLSPGEVASTRDGGRLHNGWPPEIRLLLEQRGEETFGEEDDNREDLSSMTCYESGQYSGKSSGSGGRWKAWIELEMHGGHATTMWRVREDLEVWSF